MKKFNNLKRTLKETEKEKSEWIQKHSASENEKEDWIKKHRDSEDSNKSKRNKIHKLEIELRGLKLVMSELVNDGIDSIEKREKARKEEEEQDKKAKVPFVFLKLACFKMLFIDFDTLN